MKHSFIIVSCVLMLLSGLMAGCGDDTGSGSSGPGHSGTSGWAPDNPTGKDFTFYPMEEGEWRFRVMPVDLQNGNAVIISNSSTSLIQQPYCHYAQTAHNQATMKLRYDSYVIIGSSNIGRRHEYDLTLTFTSAHQGTYTGTVGVGGLGDLQYQPLSGIFTYDTTAEPDWGASGGDGGDGDGGNEEGNEPAGNYSDALGVTISNVQASNYFQHHSITVSLAKYAQTGLPAEVGFCLGNAPGVTLDNALVIREQSANYLNGFSAVMGGNTTEAGILKSGTRYYIRPYHQSGNKVTYYRETSIETLGGQITLDLRNNLIHQYEFAYDIATEGNYSVSATFRIHGNSGDFFYQKEYGPISGGSGSVIIDIDDIPYDWDEIHCFWGKVKDLNTGIIYQPPMLNGGAGESCL